METADLKGQEALRTLHLHIGIPKTASTWLQSKVFTSLEHLRYLNCPCGPLFQEPADRTDRLMASIFKRSSHIWSEFGDTIFENLIGDRDTWLADGRSLLISEEGIGRQGSRPALLAAHIREMQKSAADWGFERINIVCVFRRQDHWLASHYAQISDRSLRPGQAGFERLVRDVTSPQASRYGFGMLLDFSVLRDRLAEVVGVDRLLMLPYELLQESPHLFLRPMLERLETPAPKIQEIIQRASGAKENVRSEQGLWRLRPRRPRRVAGISVPQWSLRRREQVIRLTPETGRQIRKAYSDGNRQLADKMGVDLESYGYFDFKQS